MDLRDALLARLVEPSGPVIECVFDEPRYVKRKTAKAIGLTDTIADDEEIPLWLPISQIDGDIPELGSWVESVCIPQWLANEKGF